MKNEFTTKSLSQKGSLRFLCVFSCLFALVVMLLLPFSSFSQNTKTDSLLLVLKTVKQDTNKVFILNNLSEEFSEKSQYEKAIITANEAAKLSEKIFFLKGQTTSFLNIGRAYQYEGKYLKALEYYFKALKIDEKIGDKKSISILLGNIGLIYNDQGDYNKALKYYEKALKTFEEIGEKKGIALNLGNIGNIHNNKGEYNKALEYYFKSIKINEELKEDKEKSINLSNIGVVYCQLGSYDKSLGYFLSALKIRKDLGDKRGIEINMGNIGSLYMEQKKYKDAEEYFRQALVIAGEIYDLEGVAELRHNLSELYERQNQWQLSLNYYKKYVVSKDSLFDEIKSKQITEIQTKYESEKKDKELVQKDAKLQKQEVEAKQKSLERKTFILGFLVMALFLAFIVRSLRVTRKQKLTIEIQNKETQEQKKIIEEKNLEITDSISYAQRIQNSFLTSEKYISQRLSDYFIFYNPRNIVSGDFYWLMEKENDLYVCTADCTGHGIPGAFMSFISMGILNEILFSKSLIKHTDEILNELRRIIILAVNPEGASEEGKDGMDAVLCRFDFKRMELEYSAANNSFYIIRNGELLVFKPDKMPVGKHVGLEKTFTRTIIPLQKGDCIYTFSDGYADQFGGPNGKKFMSKQLKELLLVNSHLSMKEQKKFLAQTFDDWKGNIEQVDDVLMIGVRV